MNLTRRKRLAVMIAGTTTLFVIAVATHYVRHRLAAPGSPDSSSREICFGILFALFIVVTSLGWACIVRCSSRPESEQGTCKWLCALLTLALSALLFAVTILYCGPPTPTGPIP